MITLGLYSCTKLITRILKEKVFHCFIKPFTFLGGDKVNNLLKSIIYYNIMY